MSDQKQTTEETKKKVETKNDSTIVLEDTDAIKQLTPEEEKKLREKQEQKRKEKLQRIQQRKEYEKQKKKEKKEKAQKSEKKQEGKKKETKLGITVKKSENFAEWYQQVITKSEMIDYYNISGCYVLRPWCFKIWELIRAFMDEEFEKLGVQNCYFPMFITKRALETEKEHVSGFAPEVAWVTHSGTTKLSEPIAIRPTSETVMYPHYAKWIRSHKDLPLKLNQWCNVVRWEFKHPIPFLRGREFLWQEGHTAFATKEEAEKEVQDILDIYRRVYEELCAVPVTKGKKSELEKFAGGYYTTTIESYIEATGRSVQSATSHCLGQNFSHMFGIQFETETGKEKQYVWQNSWGLSTRTLGVLIMVHGDDKGLVLPPKVAPIQVVIVPIFKAKLDRSAVEQKVKEIEQKLKKLKLRVTVDNSDNTPGWKYNYWELRGVPLRIEVGNLDVEKKQVAMARRDKEKSKEFVPDEKVEERVVELLEDIQQSLFKKAKEVKDKHTVTVTEWKDFVPALDKKNICLVPWCQKTECEEKIKEKSKAESSQNQDSSLSGSAKSLCMPFDKEMQKPIQEGTKCFHCGDKATIWCLFGRSY